MFKFSLLVATLGRSLELSQFLDSLTVQIFPINEFEVIIIDQNTDHLIDRIIADYENKLNIKHLKSTTKGLSYNRNLGKTYSNGRYLCVPDDDCAYYPDTLQNVWEEIENQQFPDMIIGRVFDRNTQKNVFKKTPKNKGMVTFYNFYSMTTSISLFFKNNEISFDENFGVGGKYHSNEDGDFILSYLAQKKKVVYSPHIECNHPPYNSLNTNIEKLFKYGIGFGAMCKKHSSFPINYLFFKVIVYQILILVKCGLVLDRDNLNRRWNSLSGRINGYFLFK